MNRSILLTVLIVLLPVGGTAAQQSVTWPEAFDQPIELLDDILGDFHYPISSTSDQAQRYFDQGFQLMYAFTPEEAARSFRAAQQADPDCAICYWGEAWAWGPYLNGSMSEADGPRAWVKLQQALEHIEHASAREADMIRALSERYGEAFDPERRRERDEAYAQAMGELASRYPDDLDIQTLYADALFLLEERRGYRDLDDPDVIRLHDVLTGVLERDIRHPGACHLYIHATESTPTPDLAANCARYLGDAIPGASHINHMPSHTWNEMGLWDEAVRANIKAWHTDQKAAHDQGLAIYPSHNLHMLLYAASMGGQGALAMQAGRDLGELTGDFSQYGLTLIRFGRFERVADMGPRPAGDVSAGMWDFAQGYAALKLGDKASARAMQERLAQLAAETEAQYRFHEASNILTPLAEILDGEIRWQDGDLEAAAAAFERATAVYDRLDYDEPEPLPFAPRHWLGALYLETGDYQQAADVYERDLSDHPRNGWALFGLREARKAMDLPHETVEREFNQSWARADIWLRSSRF